jgi:hypothetical protein
MKIKALLLAAALLARVPELAGNVRGWIAGIVGNTPGHGEEVTELSA